MGPALSVIPVAGAAFLAVRELFRSGSSPPHQNDTMAILEKQVQGLQEALDKGIQPVKQPTEEQYRLAKEKLQYRNDHFHFAIAGLGGSGKSSLINAFRGLRNNDPRAAPTGVVETTNEVGRYPDPDSHPPRKWTVWYDFPGAGTPKVSDWQYFNDQGLFIFDFIILAIDVRFTKTDVAILNNSRRFGIPTFIVRSKANQYIQNIMNDTGCNEAEAREKFIVDTRGNIETNLREVGAPAQQVYIVSKDNLCALIQGGTPEGLIDERQLILDLISAAYHRRYAPSS